LCWPAQQASAREWVRIETPNFIVFGEPSEKRLRDVADEFERFREALGRVIPAGATRAAVPTIVVVFNSQRSFAPYRPRYAGKPVTLAGYFVATTHQNLVALALENREHALRTIFHEYAHLAIANVARDLPVWLSEGLAEYYSTFSVQDEGRTAVVGGPILEHVLRLRQERLILHDELLTVETSSPLYNEGERRSVFYAQSWALVHMLTSGQPDRSKELQQYLSLTATGTPADTAWHKVFGALKVTAELTSYLNRDRLKAYRYRFDQDIPAVRGAATVPSDGEVDAALADLLYHVDARDDAVKRLEATLAEQPGSPHSAALLGLARLDQHRPEEAGRLLLTAAQDAGDWLVQYRVATGLVRLLEQLSVEESGPMAKAALRALDTVLAARPDLANALAFRATISVETGTDLAAGLEAIRRARVLAPGREDYAFEEARLLVERREFEEARDVLGPLMTTRYHTDVREHARRLMTQVVRLESSANPVLQPGYRPVREGEKRTEGLLEQIACSSDGVVLHVRAGDRIVRFTSERLESIEFITYRPEIQGRISCHTRVPPDPVFVTWRPSDRPTSDGLIVAVEFLPVRSP
jgi:hypothetical protein